MGTFSKYHRYREAGEEANVVNTEKFGEPERSLFTSTKVFTLHHEISITDDSDKVVYSSQSYSSLCVTRPTSSTRPVYR